ncbi:MAG: RIO1 family regulatory kinase/ATPase [Candidatus Nitrosocaldus sp.]
MHSQMSSNSIIVPIEYLLREPFVYLIRYPYNSDNRALEDARARVREMEALGVKGILLEGKSVVHGLNVLGKGCTSIVVKALLDVHGNGACNSGDDVEDYSTNYNNDDEVIVALKMMRSDSGRVSMEHEANMLAIANKVGIGPRLISYSKNLLAMELIDGIHMVELVKELESKSKSSNKSNKSNFHPIHIRSILNDILEQCFLLDSIGLDHGELSNMNRHVMISNRAYIIDFESSSTTRRVANVTSAVSYILFGRGSRVLVDILNLYTRSNEVIDALRRYRLDMSRERFNELLTLLDLKFYK